MTVDSDFSVEYKKGIGYAIQKLNYPPDKKSGTKFDTGKPRIGLVPPIALTSVADVFTYGAEKYGAHNWRKGIDHLRLHDGAARHLLSWLGGENIDPESGKPHLAHAACGILMLLESQELSIGKDDRHSD